MITTQGRTDIDALFEKSGILTTKLNHTPFIIFKESGKNIEVEIVKSAKQLTTYDEKFKVMVQWAGKYSSDFFQFTVKDVKDFMINNPKDHYC